MMVGGGMLDILQVLIAIALMYLLVSIIVTSIQEVIANLLDLRAKALEKRLQELFVDQDLQKLYADPFVSVLLDGEKKKVPSYIPSHVLSNAVIAMTGAEGVAQEAEAIVAAIKAWTEEGPQGDPPHTLRRAVRSLLAQGETDIAAIRHGVEEWYDSAMKRLSSDYKRTVHYWTLVIGFFVAVLLNADSVGLAGYLMRNLAITQVLSNAAKGITQTNLPPDQMIQTLVSLFGKAGMPLGWQGFDWSWHRVLVAVLGWLITAFAASLGSSFWFDLLKRFVNIRAVGASPTEGKI